MTSSGSASSGVGGGASALTSVMRTAANEDSAPIARGTQDEHAAGSSAKKACFADLLGSELSAVYDALPPSDASPTTAEKKGEHEKEDASEPDARAVALALPLPPPKDAPFGTPFAWPTEALVDVKPMMRSAVEASPPHASETKVAVADAGDSSAEPAPAEAAVEDASDASAILEPGLPQLSSAKAREKPARASATYTAAQQVGAAEPASPNAIPIPIPAQMTPSATAVAASVTTPTLPPKTAEVTPSASVAVAAPSRQVPVTPARAAAASGVTVGARSASYLDAGSATASASASASNAGLSAASSSDSGTGASSPSPSRSSSPSASRSAPRGVFARAGAGDEAGGSAVSEPRRVAAEELPTAAALTPFTPSAVILPSPSGAVASGSLTASPAKSQGGGGLVAESSGDATANAIRNAEAVGHRRVLAGDAHGALSVGELGRFEVSAKTQDDGRVEVHVRAEQRQGATLLEHHAAELRADVRIEVPRAFVAVQDSPAAHHGSSGGATDSGVQARTSDHGGSSRNGRGGGERGGSVASAPATAPKPSSNKRLARVRIVL